MEHREKLCALRFLGISHDRATSCSFLSFLVSLIDFIEFVDQDSAIDVVYIYKIFEKSDILVNIWRNIRISIWVESFKTKLITVVGINGSLTQIPKDSF